MITSKKRSKVFYIIFILICLFCIKNDILFEEVVDFNSKKSSANEISKKGIENLSSEKEKTKEKKETSYKVKNYVYDEIDNENIKVSYPQLADCKENISKKWNKIIKSKINNDLGNVENIKNYKLQYTIETQTEDLLSIVFRGVTYDIDENEPYCYAYTYNIDMKTGENKILSDFVEIEEVAHDIYNFGNYSTNIKKIKFNEYIKEFYNENEITNMLKKYDYKNDDMCPIGYSYVKRNKDVCLCMVVNHELGDLVEIELKNEN